MPPAASPSVLVTRPEPGGQETAARLRALGFAPVLAPALVLRARRFAMPQAQAVLITSRAAARALPPPVAGLPVLAVGEATAAAAREAGWADARAAAGTAVELAKLAAETLDPRGRPLLLAVGQGYALDLAADLRARGFRVIRRIAYAAEPAGSLPAPALAALAGEVPPAILFHSPRSAECAISLLREAGHAATAARMEALVISPRVAATAAAAIAPLAWRQVRVADRPDEAALLALLGSAGGPARQGGSATLTPGRSGPNTPGRSGP